MLARALTVSTMLFMLMDSVNQLGVYLGIVAWAALYLREPRLRPAQVTARTGVAAAAPTTVVHGRNDHRVTRPAFT